MVARGKVGRGLGVDGKGISKYRLPVRKQYGDVKCSVGNTVNNIVVTMFGARWALEILGGSFCKVHGCLTTMLSVYLKLIQNNIEGKLKNKFF